LIEWARAISIYPGVLQCSLPVMHKTLGAR